MTTLSGAQVAALVKKVGFPDADHVVMVAIAKAESGFKVEALNKSSASGVWQILWSAHKQYDQRKLLSDAEYNARAALDIYKSQGKNAWVAYSSGAYKEHLNLARQAVAQAANLTGNASLPTESTGKTPVVAYGADGPQAVAAGFGEPLAAAEDFGGPLNGLRIYGTEIGGDFSTVIIGNPTYSAGMETVPNIVFTIADPDGDLLARMGNIWVPGARVQFQDLDLRIDTITFEPGSHMTGQITMTCVDVIVYALMRLTGSRTAEGISATQWISQELALCGIDPNVYFLGEAVPTQTVIARDEEDQAGQSGSGDTPSAWTTIVRLAKELGRRVFMCGRRLVFGSAAFAMRWCAPGALELYWHAAPNEGVRFLTLPTARGVTIGSRSGVSQIVCRVPLNRAKYFRPGVPVDVRYTPAVTGATPVRYMVFSIDHSLGTDTDGADVTLLQPIDPPVQQPTQTTSTGANSGSTSAAGVSGGGADGTIDRFVALALAQAGDRYVFGAEVSPSDPDPNRFDCSELVEWAAARAGISPKVPDGSAAQRDYCRAKGTMVSVQTGINTKGALLFMPGHVAISLGNGKTIEAMNPSSGVRQGNANGRGWREAARIPGAKGYR